jgi:hypothetical protein
MNETPPKPPFDPVRGAFVLLMAMVLGLIANSLLLLAGCMLGVQLMCERNTDNLRQVALEVITAIALLVSQRR